MCVWLCLWWGVAKGMERCGESEKAYVKKGSGTFIL